MNSLVLLRVVVKVVVELLGGGGVVVVELGRGDGEEVEMEEVAVVAGEV